LHGGARMRNAVLSAAFILVTASAATAGPQTFSVKPNFTNPTTLATGKVKSAMESGSKLGFTGDCGDMHFQATPIATLDVTAATSKLMVSVAGPDAVAIKIGSGFVCTVTSRAGEVAQTMLDDWPAGKAEIYAGGSKQDFTWSYTLAIEELDRPVELGWDKVEKLTLDAAPKQPVAYTIDAKGATRSDLHLVNGCNAEYRAKPDLVLEVTQPVDGLEVLARQNDDGTDLRLAGPVPEDHRNVPSTCMGDRGEKRALGTLEPGLYGLYIGGNGKASPATINVVVTSKTTPRDPVAPAPTIPAKVALGERSVYLQFPQLTSDDVYHLDAPRAGLWAAAPAQLLVYIRRDLDSGNAALIRWDTNGDGDDVWPTKEAPAVAYPAKGEPVLSLGGNHVLTADGLVFEVRAEDIVDAPVGALAFPADARDPQATFAQSLAVAGADDAAITGDVDKARTKYSACFDKAWGPTATKILALKERGGITEAEQAKMDAMNRSATAKAEKKCGLAGLLKKQDAAWVKLIKSRTARRAKLLADVKARLGH